MQDQTLAAGFWVSATPYPKSATKIYRKIIADCRLEQRQVTEPGKINSHVLWTRRGMAARASFKTQSRAGREMLIAHGSIKVELFQQYWKQ